MSLERNKAVVRRLTDEVFNQGNIGIIPEIIAKDVIGHDATSTEVLYGIGLIEQSAIYFRTAFPDAHNTILDMVAEGDMVAVRWSLRGTQHGPFLDAPPTGKVVEMDGLSLYRVVADKLVEYWENFDSLGLMKYLGAVVSAIPRELDITMENYT